MTVSSSRPATAPPAPSSPPAAPSGRFLLLDALRGLALVCMIAYHACFNLDNLFGVPLPWFHTPGAHAWQFVNSGLFLLLAGLCVHFTRHIWRRTAGLFLVALALTAVTWLVMPQELIVCGILHCIAACLLLCALFGRWLARIPAPVGAALCVVLFLCTCQLPQGSLFFGPFALPLPEGLYQVYPLSFLGFPSPTFRSGDYFPLLPNVFLFLLGYYLYPAFLRLPLRVRMAGVRPLNFLGRHSLLIYLAHQPVLMGIMLLFF